jgi:hypothetical protein
MRLKLSWAVVVGNSGIFTSMRPGREIDFDESGRLEAESDELAAAGAAAHFFGQHR